MYCTAMSRGILTAAVAVTFLLTAGPADASVFTNTTVSDLELWLKADAGIVLGGGGVSQWQDQSGNLNHAGQTTTAKQPDFSAGTGPNGTDVLQFNKAASDWMAVPNAASPAASHTAFVVYNADPGQSGVMFGRAYNFGSMYMYVDTATFPGIDSMRQVINDNKTYIQNATGAWNISTGFYNSAYIAGQVLNGGGMETIAASGNLNHHASDQLAVGAFANTSGAGVGTFSGDIAEILLYDRALSTREQNVVGMYLSDKYGLATSFPMPIALMHVGQKDPESEGWNKALGGVQRTGGGNDGRDHWEIDATGSDTAYLGYRIDQNNPDLLDILNNEGGWGMTAEVKVVEGMDDVNAPFFGVRDGQDWWQLSLLGADGGLPNGVYYQNESGTSVLLHAMDVSDYHTYKMSFNSYADGGNGVLNVSVDGTPVGSLTRAQVISPNNAILVGFGEFNSSAGGSKSRWAFVELTVVPEPSTFVLLALGLVGLIGYGRRRQR